MNESDIRQILFASEIESIEEFRSFYAVVVYGDVSSLDVARLTDAFGNVVIYGMVDHRLELHISKS